jgi:hypothetical protein
MPMILSDSHFIWREGLPGEPNRNQVMQYLVM